MLSLDNLSLCACLAAGALLLACSSVAERPINVLLVVLDTTRADAVAFDSPRLAKLASDGVVYSHARSTSAWTLPAHASLFTGLYPSTHGAHHESHLLRAELSTLAELLAPTHATAGFSENPHIGSEKGFDQGFEHFVAVWRERGRRGQAPSTIDKVDRWLETRDRERPFFLFVNLMDPHLPYNPPLELARRMLPAGADNQSLDRGRRFSESDARQFVTGRLLSAAADLELLRALYNAEVAYVQERVDRILETIESQKELEQTLVIVVGDHGENIGEHGLMEHQLCLYETLLRVPLLIRLPGRFDGGERRFAPVQLVDLPPTVLELVGVPDTAWPRFEGQSLVEAQPAPARPVVAEYMRPLRQRLRFQKADSEFDFTPFDRRLQSIQVGPLKLIRSDRGEIELYDLRNDPSELKNLASERPQEAELLARRLNAWSQARQAAGAAAEPELDDETIEALRALGYLN